MHQHSQLRIGPALASLLGAAAVIACTALAVAAPAIAAPTSFGSGHLDWGIKDSFRDYVTGPIAHGSYTASNGATKLSEPNGVIRFDVLGGTYDADTGAGQLTIDGTVRFQGHDGTLDMTIRNLCASFAGGSGTLYADVTSNDMQGKPKQYTGIALVDMPTVPAPASLLDWPSINTALNAAAVPAFGSIYAAGLPFDPIEPLTATTGTPRPRPSGGPCRSVAGGGAGGGAGGSTDPDSPHDSSVNGVKKAVILARGRRVARIGTLRCGAVRCTVTTPKSVKIKIKRKRYRVDVLAPKRIAPGGSGQLRVRLSKAARKALAGRRTTVKVKVTIGAGGRKTTKTVKATLKARKARGG